MPYAANQCDLKRVQLFEMRAQLLFRPSEHLWLKTQSHMQVIKAHCLFSRAEWNMKHSSEVTNQSTERWSTQGICIINMNPLRNLNGELLPIVLISFEITGFCTQKFIAILHHLKLHNVHVKIMYIYIYSPVWLHTTRHASFVNTPYFATKCCLFQPTGKWGSTLHFHETGKCCLSLAFNSSSKALISWSFSLNGDHRKNLSDVCLDAIKEPFWIS